MAASNQALAVGKGQPRVRREVPVRRYTEVTLEGDVEDYVRARVLRAPLLLLAGLAASAAQTLEPLWPVSASALQCLGHNFCAIKHKLMLEDVQC